MNLPLFWLYKFHFNIGSLYMLVCILSFLLNRPCSLTYGILGWVGAILAKLILKQVYFGLS